jgi:hypothetical protein
MLVILQRPRDQDWKVDTYAGSSRNEKERKSRVPATQIYFYMSIKLLRRVHRRPPLPFASAWHPKGVKGKRRKSRSSSDPL